MSARVLVVDDVPTNVKLLEAKLTSEYFDVTCATSGEEALEKVRDDQPDIILLDVMMPGLDGFEVCRRLKKDSSTMHIPVVMVTALDQPSDRVTGLEAGADDFLTKPVDDIALFARVRSLARLKMVTDELRMREATRTTLGAGDGSGDLQDEEITDARILVIEDKEHTRNRIVETLEPVTSKITCCDGADMDAVLHEADFDLVIVSLNLAGVDGLRLCSILRTSDRTRNTPILILVEDGETDRLVRGMDMGVNDYLIRPVDRNELLARVRTQVRRKRYSDALRENVQQSVKLAVTDAVTGLHNRHYMSSHLETLLGRAVQGGKPVSVLMLDIDFFKAVNDRHGHGVGDQVLRGFGERLSHNIRGIDLAARYGGEEFVVIMPDTDLALAESIANRLLRQISDEPFETTSEAGAVPITASIGVATSRVGKDSADALIERADAALYEAKRQGRNRVVVAPA